MTGHRVRAGADWARKKPGGGGGDRGGGSGGGFGGRDSGLCHDFTLGRCERGDRCRFAHEAPRPVAPTVALPRAGAPPARGAAGGGACGLASRVLGGEPGSAAASDDPDEALGEGELGERYPLYKPVVVKALAALDHAAVDLDLLAELVAWIMAHGTVAAVQQAVGAGGGAADDAWGGGGGAGAGDARGGARAHPAPRAPEPAADSILVFLPGVKEITAAFEALTQGGPLAHEPQRSWVLPLHSLLSSDEQRRIFMRPPDGVRKVVLATNMCGRPRGGGACGAGAGATVAPDALPPAPLSPPRPSAETSITIDDCGFVIDCGRMKETRYDPARRMESLEDVAVSRANAKQRRGRAGRVKSGVCFHLVTRHAFERRLDAAQAPEMHRVPLEQLVLRIKVLRYPGTAAQVVARCLQPPAPEAVSRAVTELVRLDALTLTERGDEALTPLGTHLAALPVDVRIGKLILLGAIFGLTDDVRWFGGGGGGGRCACELDLLTRAPRSRPFPRQVLTIAAVLSGRPPFLSPFERRAEADASKRAFCVAQSDHLTALNAYREFDRGGAGRFDMCRERFLGVKTLITIAGVKRQLLELLSDARFVRPGLRARGVEALGRRVDGSDGVRLALEEGLAGGDACFRCGGRGHAARDCAEPARSQPRALQSADDAWRRDTLDAPLIKALLTAALYPQVMTVTAPPRAKGGGGKPPSAGQLKFHIREDSGDVVEVAIHPSSVNAREGAFDSPYLVFLEKVRTTRVYVRDCSTVSPYALLLFGGALHADRKGAADQVVTVDGWIRFSLPRKAVELIISVRNEMNAVLKRKIERPAEDVSAAGRHILDAVAQLISTQG